MKNKILLIIFLLITYLISIKFKNDNLSYISIGDGLSKGINSNYYESKGYSDYIYSDLQENNKIEIYTKSFSSVDERITSLIQKINNNEYIYLDGKKKTIQNLLKKSNIVTLSVGMNEILYKYKSNSNDSYMYNYIDECMNDMNRLIKLIKKYNNTKIFILSYYNINEDDKLNKYIIYANNRLKKLCKENSIYYVNLYNIFKNNNHLIYNKNNFFPNQDGYKLISKEILKMYKNM